MNTDKEFVPYQQSLDMKELGFDEPCFGYYNVSNQELIEDLSNNRTGNDDLRWASAPLYQQAFRWFRKKYNLHILINVKDGIWYFERFSINGFNTYEEAELECLKKLIEIVKNNNK